MEAMALADQRLLLRGLLRLIALESLLGDFGDFLAAVGENGGAIIPH